MNGRPARPVPPRPQGLRRLRPLLPSPAPAGGHLPSRDVPMSWSSMARIWACADILSARRAGPARPSHADSGLQGPRRGAALGPPPGVTGGPGRSRSPDAAGRGGRAGAASVSRCRCEAERETSLAVPVPPRLAAPPLPPPLLPLPLAPATRARASGNGNPRARALHPLACSATSARTGLGAR